MIINSDILVTYRGDGQTVNFPFSFPFYAPEYICVKILDETTGEVTKLDSDYYVDAAGSKVVYPGYEPGTEPPEADQPPKLPETSTLTIYRNTEISQLVELGEKFPLPVIEGALDKITEILQELNSGISRSLKVDETSTVTPDEQMQHLLNIADDAIAAATAAAISESSAALSASNAYNSAETAANNANLAIAAQGAATTSAENAANSAAAAEGAAGIAATNAANAEQSAISARAYSAPDWDVGTAYTAGDVVTYVDGSSYRCIADCTGVVPTDTSYWAKITSYLGDDFWLVDGSGYIVPNEAPTYSGRWSIDVSGYIIPINNVA